MRLVAIALLGASCSLVRAHYPAPLAAGTEHHRVAVAPGVELQLERYPAAAPVAGRRPVLLLHGIITNGRNFDVDERHSMARWLAARGFDTWVLSLRGTGASTTPAWNFDFDTFANEDIPAAIAYVRQATGAAALDVVGHSMGGLLVYAVLARGKALIATAVTLGAPERLGWLGVGGKFAPFVAVAGARLPWIPMRSLGALYLPIAGVFDGPVERVLTNYGNVEPAAWQRFTAVGMDDLSPALVGSFSRWLETGAFDGDDGFDYRAALAHCDRPVLVVAGKADAMAPVRSVLGGYRALGSKDKAFRIVGVENGASADYGHMDLLIADHADRDVFPLVERWLLAHEARGL